MRDLEGRIVNSCPLLLSLSSSNKLISLNLRLHNAHHTKPSAFPELVVQELERASQTMAFVKQFRRILVSGLGCSEFVVDRVATWPDALPLPKLH
jgi:hypothetical protein